MRARDVPALLLCLGAPGCGSSNEPSESAPESGAAGFARAVLTRDAKNPLALAVTPALDVYFVERTGEVRLYEVRTGRVSLAARLDVDTAHENGLLGIALDPAFSSNRFVYLYYSAPRDGSEPDEASSGPPGENRLVRFSAGSDGTLELASAHELLSVPSERRCCHEGGALELTHDGKLLLATGDNTNPFESGGAAPLDDRPGRERYDARRTAGNPFDLRGKILRLELDGSVPAGNLFPADGSLGRPEIYVMGVRNPFRLAADPASERLFFGDVGPDGSDDSERGPRGYDELNLASAPGDYGWPFCIGPNLPYAAFDFSSGEPGPPFDCSDKLPSLLAYDYTTATYPALGTGYAADGTFVGRTVIAGAVYRTTPGSELALPSEFEGALVMADWTRSLLARVEVGASGELRAVERVLAGEELRRPIDVAVGPDNALYVLEYGSDFWGDNPDARLSRIEHGPLAKLAPIGEIQAEPAFGAAPLRVELSAEGSRSPEPGGTLVDFAWDLDADGRPDAHGARLTHTFERSGTHTVSLTVTASNGRKSRPVALEIVAGNVAPTVRILAPVRGSALSLSQPIALVGEGSDPEDGIAPCDELVWNIGLVHNTHAHPLGSTRGCEATFTPDIEDHSADAARLSYAIELVYTDRGGPLGEAPLVGRQGIELDVVAP